VREKDRPLEERVSVLDRAPTESDVIPEPMLTGAMRQEVDVASVRLALTFDDCRIYVGLGSRSESLFLCVDGPNGGGGGTGPRATLVTHGARLQSSGGITIGIVADAVTAVRVGEVEAMLANNVFRRGSRVLVRRDRRDHDRGRTNSPETTAAGPSAFNDAASTRAISTVGVTPDPAQPHHPPAHRIPDRHEVTRGRN